MFRLRNSVLFLCWTLLSVHGLVLGRLLSPPPALLKISSTRLCILAYEESICRFPGDSSVKSFLLLLSLVFIVSPHALVLQVSKGLWANSPTAQRYFSVVPVGSPWTQKTELHPFNSGREQSCLWDPPSCLVVWKHFWLTKLGHLFISLLSELVILLCQLSNSWQLLFHDILPRFLIVWDEKFNLVPVTLPFALEQAQFLRAVYSKPAFPHIPGFEVCLQCHLCLFWSLLHLHFLCLLFIWIWGFPPLYSVLTHLLDSLFQSVSAEGATDLLRDLDLPLTQRCSLLFVVHGNEVITHSKMFAVIW